MDYRSILKEENENAAERFSLSLERIREIPKEQEVPDKVREYCSGTAGFTEMFGRLCRNLGENR